VRRSVISTHLTANPRAVAALVVRDVLEHGRFLDQALDERLAALPVAPTAPALIQELAYGTLRWYHQLAGIAALFLAKPLKQKDQDVYTLLLIGLYQLRFTRVAAHAAVTETVAAAEALGKPWAKALINACLRSAQRARARIANEIARSSVLRYSHPAWLIDALQRAYPQRWASILEADNERPPMVLRVNRRRTTAAEYVARLGAAGIAAQHIGDGPDGAVILEKPVPVATLPGFAAGVVSVQDAAAQWAAILLDAQPGERILDACVAPGGKAADIVERQADIELVGIDIDAGRLARARENFARLRLSARLIEADAAAPARWWDGKPFDRILVDAPCSATGVIRRHPDIKVRRTPADIAVLTDTQRRLLDGVWPCLRRGGKLLYATCSVLPEENQVQMEAFFARHADAARTPVNAGADDWQIVPGERGMDGFYYARAHKR